MPKFCPEIQVFVCNSQAENHLKADKQNKICCKQNVVSFWATRVCLFFLYSTLLNKYSQKRLSCRVIKSQYTKRGTKVRTVWDTLLMCEVVQNFDKMSQKYSLLLLNSSLLCSHVDTVTHNRLCRKRLCLLFGIWMTSPIPTLNKCNQKRKLKFHRSYDNMQ